MIKDYLPSVYDKSQVMRDIMDAVQAEIDRLNSHVAFNKLQLYINTATDGLTEFETMLGIESREGDEYQTRRARCIIKLKNLKYTSLYSLIELGSVFGFSVSSSADIASINIDYSGLGIPMDFEESKKIINNNVAAGVKVIWNFTFNLWNTISGNWGSISQSTWADILS